MFVKSIYLSTYVTVPLKFLTLAGVGVEPHVTFNGGVYIRALEDREAAS